jgi:hypothetical protein
MPHAHWDVQVKPFIHLKAVPRGEAAVLLEKSSPFMTCTVSAVPAAPVRDLSANVGSLLTAVAGIGAVPTGLGGLIAGGTAGPELSEAVEPFAAVANTGIQELDALIDHVQKIEKDATNDYKAIEKGLKDFRAAMKKDWKFSFDSPGRAEAAISDLGTYVEEVSEAFDSFTKLGGELSLLDDEATRFDKDIFPSHPEITQRYRAEQRNIIRLKARIDLLKARVSDFGDQRKLVLLVRDYLVVLKGRTKDLYTSQALPMAYFSGKSATETITCKDAITKDPAFDNVIFTAYYEPVPHLDVSVGAIGSLLGGQQVAAVTAPFTQAQAAACAATAAAAPAGSYVAPCGPSTLLGYKSRSAYQFMPGVFVEWRFKNFRCPWAENGAPWHPGGYVCSFGPAGGVAINPNNGGPAAEFFEGVSFGIQRFSLLVGVHNGRYQQFGGGYYLGEVFPPGTSVTPPTAYGWAKHPAFAIAYRIPIR